MKNSNDTIGNRTRDLPTCSAVPQPTAPPRAPIYQYTHLISLRFEANEVPTVLVSFPCGATTKIGSGLPRFEVSRSHTIRHKHAHTHSHTHLVGVLWTSDHLVAEAAIHTTHNKHNRRTSMHTMGFEPAIPLIKQPHFFSNDPTATEICTFPPSFSYIQLSWDKL
jgi:hypothetical protein